jgi:hypothetical protein
MKEPKTSLSTSASCDDSQSSIEQGIIYERLRQARLSFNLTLILTAASGLVALGGIGLFFTGRLTEGAVTTAGGFATNIVSVRCLQLTKEANDRLDRIAKSGVETEKKI